MSVTLCFNRVSCRVSPIDPNIRKVMRKRIRCVKLRRRKSLEDIFYKQKFIKNR